MFLCSHGQVYSCCVVAEGSSVFLHPIGDVNVLSCSYLMAILFYFILFKYLFIFEIENTSRGGAEREGDTENGSRLQALGCQHIARHGARTHKLRL